MGMTLMFVLFWIIFGVTFTYATFRIDARSKEMGLGRFLIYSSFGYLMFLAFVVTFFMNLDYKYIILKKK